MVRDIPTAVNFHIRLFCGVYMPEQTIPIEVEAHGQGIFRFEPTEKPSKRSVQIESISLRVVPFAMAIDIDGDGVLERLEITEADLSDFVDLTETQGQLDLESQRLSLTWVFRLSPSMVSLPGEPATVTVADHGYLDPETGEFELHAGVFQIEQGLFQGALVRGSVSGCVGGTQLEFRAIIAGTDTECYEVLRQPHPTDVWACPGDELTLCWYLRPDTCNDIAYDRIEIDPLGKTFPPSTAGQTRAVVPADFTSNPIEFTATVFDVQGRIQAVATASVNIYEGNWLEFNAEPDETQMNWSIKIPRYSISGKIMADCIQLLQNDPCLQWRHFFLEHSADPTAPGSGLIGIRLYSLDETPLAPAKAVAGTWRFYTLDEIGPTGEIIAKAPQPNDYRSPVCFHLRGKCE